jgi:hypothetical protein
MLRNQGVSCHGQYKTADTVVPGVVILTRQSGLMVRLRRLRWEDRGRLGP